MNKMRGGMASSSMELLIFALDKCLHFIFDTHHSAASACPFSLVLENCQIEILIRQLQLLDFSRHHQVPSRQGIAFAGCPDPLGAEMEGDSDSGCIGCRSIKMSTGII